MFLLPKGIVLYYRKAARATSIFFIFLALFTSCINTDVRLFVQDCPAPRRTPEQIETVYKTPPEVKILGTLTIRYNAGYARSKVVDRMKAEAAKCGADGLVLSSIRTAPSEWSIRQGEGSHSSTARATAYEMETTMFRYKD